MKFFLTVKYKKKTICDQCNAFWCKTVQ
jgi:hypothetical protein